MTLDLFPALAPASVPARMQNFLQSEFGAALALSGSTDKIDCGTGTSLDNLQPWTCCAWVYLTSTATNRIYQKGAGANAQVFAALDTGNVSVFTARATTNATALSASSNFAFYGQNKWLFYVGQVDTGTAGNNKLFVGDLANAPAEPSSYSVQQAGTGTVGNNNAAAAVVGNRAANSTPIVGRLACMGVWSGLLGAVELRQQWDFSRQHGGLLLPTAGIRLMLAPGFNGVGSQRDWSGYNNHGTVTGATYSPFGVPVLTAPEWHRRFGFVAAATGKPWIYYALQRAQAGAA